MGSFKGTMEQITQGRMAAPGSFRGTLEELQARGGGAPQRDSMQAGMG